MSALSQNETPGQSGRSGIVPGRGGALDLLRFLAAVLIVLYHFGQDAPVALDSLHPVFGRGYLATDFFLILSGYVLGRAYGGQVLSGRIGPVRFLGKRIQRLWPAQLIVLLLLALVVLASGLVGLTPDHPEHYTLKAFAMQMVFAQAWGIPGGGGWNHQSWSLSALVVCYGVFPLLWSWISRMRSSVAMLALGMLAVVGGDLLCVSLLGRPIYDLEFHFGLIRALPLFLLGLCIAKVVEQNRPSLIVAPLLGWLAAGTLVLLQLAGRFDLASIVAIAAVVLSCGRTPVAEPSKLIEEGAKLSFALFITHALTGMIWFGALQVLNGRFDLPVSLQWVLWAGSIPAALVVALVFHRWVDAPLQSWLAQRLKRPQAATA
ncbi:MAG: acyltransferase [Caulobacteraceae bacterium]|nr:MAG: acyltransferase [Caulobacteraceae bacterium]